MGKIGKLIKYWSSFLHKTSDIGLVNHRIILDRLTTIPYDWPPDHVTDHQTIWSDHQIIWLTARPYDWPPDHMTDHQTIWLTIWLTTRPCHWPPDHKIWPPDHMTDRQTIWLTTRPYYLTTRPCHWPPGRVTDLHVILQCGDVDLISDLVLITPHHIPDHLVIE